MAKKKTPEELFEKLARMVKRGFDDTATKSDLAALGREIDAKFHGVDGKFREAGGKFQTIADSLEQLRRDMREVKVILGPLARGMVLSAKSD